MKGAQPKEPGLRAASPQRKISSRRQRGAAKTASGGVSDLKLDDWRTYGDILTDSLWVLGARDRSGTHDGGYHGNFIPQIPNQLIRRYTREGGVVLDGFLGGGTTMIEAGRLGRSCIGVELLPEVAKKAERAVVADADARRVSQDEKRSERRSGGASDGGEAFREIIVGDSASSKTIEKIRGMLASRGRAAADLVILHPPYHDIIKFSGRKNDMSNAPDTDAFVRRFGDAAENYASLLAGAHYMAVVIGDKYAESRWVPLGFMLMDEVMRRTGMALKSIVVKNMANNRAKRNQERLWRFRALAGGFYVFRHEYIILFQKPEEKSAHRGRKKK